MAYQHGICILAEGHEMHTGQCSDNFSVLYSLSIRQVAERMAR
jgi:hypothetical protein